MGFQIDSERRNSIVLSWAARTIPHRRPVVGPHSNRYPALLHPTSGLTTLPSMVLYSRVRPSSHSSSTIFPRSRAAPAINSPSLTRRRLSSRTEFGDVLHWPSTGAGYHGVRIWRVPCKQRWLLTSLRLLAAWALLTAHGTRPFRHCLRWYQTHSTGRMCGLPD